MVDSYKTCESMPSKDFLADINSSEEKPFGMSQRSNPITWTDQKLGGGIIGDIKISFPEISDGQLQKIKNEMINSIVPAQFARLNHLQKELKDSNLEKVFRLVPM